MSVVPLLVALYLLHRATNQESTILGLDGLLFVLMIASAVAGFFFIKTELARTFLSIFEDASRQASGDLTDRIREASVEEISKISEAIERITSPGEVAGPMGPSKNRERLQDGITRVAQGIHASRDAAHLLEFLVEGALESVDGRTAYLMAVDEEEGDFETIVAHGEFENELSVVRIPLGEGVPGLAARERRAILLPGSGGSMSPSFGLSLPQNPTTTMATPLFQGEMLQGILIVHDRRDGDLFDEDDLALFANLATLTSAALGSREERERIEDGFDALLGAFSAAIEEKDPYTRGHARRVASYCTAMGKALRLDDDTMRTLHRAALLHDVGKLALPDTLRKKEGRFTEEELEHVRTHPTQAEKMLRDIPTLASLVPIIRHHHERCDGSGYPDGLLGDEIPLPTHILIVANAFDVMTSDRSYRKAMSMSEALQQVQEGTGELFDPRVVGALLGLDKKILKGTQEVGGEGSTVKGQGNASISIRD
jgi:HD-GYP domain-containing protein (c-di-GMP phosphodiesterase class II)